MTGSDVVAGKKNKTKKNNLKRAENLSTCIVLVSKKPTAHCGNNHRLLRAFVSVIKHTAERYGFGLV